jgi:hypothetical protein
MLLGQLAAASWMMFSPHRCAATAAYGMCMSQTSKATVTYVLPLLLYPDWFQPVL